MPRKKKTGELNFMKSVWANKYGSLDVFGQCQECRINIPFSPYHVCHVLSKGSRPDLRLNEDNIIILCSEHHDQLDAGKYPERMLIAPIIAKIKQKFKKKQDFINSGSILSKSAAFFYLMENDIPFDSKKQDIEALAITIFNKKNPFHGT